jgi:hypothetical protein
MPKKNQEKSVSIASWVMVMHVAGGFQLMSFEKF